MNIIERRELINMLYLDNLTIQINMKNIELDYYAKSKSHKIQYRITKAQVEDLAERIKATEEIIRHKGVAGCSAKVMEHNVPSIGVVKLKD